MTSAPYTCVGIGTIAIGANCAVGPTFRPVSNEELKTGKKPSTATFIINSDPRSEVCNPKPIRYCKAESFYTIEDALEALAAKDGTDATLTIFHNSRRWSIVTVSKLAQAEQKK